MKEALENNGFISLCEIKVEDAHEGRLSLDIEKHHLNPYDFAHGGLIYTLADTAMGICLSESGTFVTVNSHINFLKPANCKKLISQVDRVRLGKRIAVLNCYIYNESVELIATVTGTYCKYNHNSKTNKIEDKQNQN